MFGRIGVLEGLILPFAMMAMIGPVRLAMMAAHATGLAAGGR